MANKLRVAGVGAGYFSQFHYDGWQRIEDADLIAVCNRSGAAAEEIAKTYGAEETFTDLATMLDAVKPDLLDIILPPAAQLEAIEAACRRGVHAICQKPFLPDLDTAQKAVDMAGRAGIRLVVHENFRFQPWYREIRRQIDRGLIGKPISALFRLRPGDGQGADAYLARQPYFRDMPRFLIRETGIHLIDTFRYLFGEARGVTARLRRLNPHIAGEDAGYVIMEFDSDMSAVFDGNRLIDHPGKNKRLTMGEFIIEGEDGVLMLDGDAGLHFRQMGNTDWREIAYAWEDRGFAGDCCHALQSHVVDHLLHGRELENDGAAYLTNLRLEAAVYQSHDQGCRICPETPMQSTTNTTTETRGT